MAKATSTTKPALLPILQMGNPVLAQRSRNMKLADIKHPGTKKLVEEMFYTVRKVNGVGLAAPQVGQLVRLAVVDIRPTKLRPRLKIVKKKIFINPRILKTWPRKEKLI